MKHLKLFEDYFKGNYRYLDDDDFDDEGGIESVDYNIKKYINPISKQLGYDIDEDNFLSKGFFGEVYDVGNKALKITTDYNEALTANSLRGKSLKHVVGYYDVREINIENNFTNTYSIVMDKVIPLTDMKDSEDLSLMWTAMRGKYTKTKSGRTNFKYVFFNENMNNMDVANFYYAECGAQTRNKESVKKIFRIIMDQRKSILKEFKKYNIKPKDAHAGNIGFKDINGELIFCLFDPSRGARKGKNINLKSINVDVILPKDEKWFIKFGYPWSNRNSGKYYNEETFNRLIKRLNELGYQTDYGFKRLEFDAKALGIKHTPGHSLEFYYEESQYGYPKDFSMKYRYDNSHWISDFNI